MAEGDGALYAIFPQKLMTGEIDLVDHVIKLAILDNYTPDVEAHETWSDVSGSEASGSGYTAGGATIANGSVSWVSSDTEAVYDADDYTWTSLNVGTNLSHFVMHDTTPSDDWLIGYWETETPTNGGNYGVEFNADGIIGLAINQ